MKKLSLLINKTILNIAVEKQNIDLIKLFINNEKINPNLPDISIFNLEIKF